MRTWITFLVASCAAFAQTSPAGKWISTLSSFGEPRYNRLQLELSGSKLTGKFDNEAFDGSFQNGGIEGTVKLNPRTTIELHGTFAGDRITGTGMVVEQKLELKWEAMREPARSAAPQTHTFEPTEFQHFFSDAIAPALHIAPGDTVRTWSVDAGGTDPKGVRRTSGGNPLTGPFYIDGAIPGDTLVVHFTRIRLNRDSAGSGAMIVNGALNAGYVEQRKRVEGYDSSWKLDRQAGFASLAKPTESMRDYKVPLAPMLGCVGVAPQGGMRYRSGFLGSYGGNMDYNQLREGAMVYLPVYAPGALLFVGDGHAAQGAGELTGDALETSMDIEFTVDVQAGGAPPAPRMENAEYLMASGIAGSIDEAFREATTNLVRWLERTYGLNAAEVSSVLGTAIVYDIAEVVDPQPHIVAKVPKASLAGLRKPAQP
ncbi:MAG: acetamidase/formamidase family protein [Bryobacterales bacterium]|nr:acetamidase/formamidase family protein [Bryobacterales bacterium]MBV9400735.1 acetamidase/formamidase family protein [Bryobacterales bacterium]